MKRLKEIKEKTKLRVKKEEGKGKERNLRRESETLKRREEWWREKRRNKGKQRGLKRRKKLSWNRQRGEKMLIRKTGKTKEGLKKRTKRRIRKDREKTKRGTAGANWRRKKGGGRRTRKEEKLGKGR